VTVVERSPRLRREREISYIISTILSKKINPLFLKSEIKGIEEKTCYSRSPF
jgi:hypothetical protein